MWRGRTEKAEDTKADFAKTFGVAEDMAVGEVGDDVEVPVAAEKKKRAREDDREPSPKAKKEKKEKKEKKAKKYVPWETTPGRHHTDSPPICNRFTNHRRLGL